MTDDTEGGALALLANEEGYDSIEDRLRAIVRQTIEAMFEQELAQALVLARLSVRACDLAALGTFAIFAPALVVAYSIDISPGLREAASRFGHHSLVLSGVSLYALLGVIAFARGPHDWIPFALTALFFVAMLATLATIMWPYMVPYSLTVAAAAAPEASLRFFLCGGVVVLPGKSTVSPAVSATKV